MDLFLIAVAILVILDALSPHPNGIPKFHNPHERWTDPWAVHFNLAVQAIAAFGGLVLVFAGFLRKKQ